MQDLYTPADVKKVRDKLVEQQNGIDPILKEPFKEPPACDHDHVTQKVRGALGRNSNAFEGKVFNAFVRCLRWQTDLTLPQILRNLADYLETDVSGNPHHPAWMKRIKTDFNALPEAKKEVLLNKFSLSGKNGKERKEEFRKLILSRKVTFLQLSQLIKDLDTKN